MESTHHRSAQPLRSASAAAVATDIRRCTAELDHPPTKEEYETWQLKHPEAQALDVITWLCGSWHVARREAGFPVAAGTGFQPRERSPADAEALRRHVQESLKTAAEELGSSFSRRVYAAYAEKTGEPLASVAEIKRAYGTFPAALAVVGLTPAQPAPVKRGPLVEELVRGAADAVDGRLTVRKFDPIRHDHLPPGLLVAPNAKAIGRQYPGGWPGAVQAALGTGDQAQ